MIYRVLYTRGVPQKHLLAFSILRKMLLSLVGLRHEQIWSFATSPEQHGASYFLGLLLLQEGLFGKLPITSPPLSTATLFLVWLY